jgi:hypothetical protein
MNEAQPFAGRGDSGWTAGRAHFIALGHQKMFDHSRTDLGFGVSDIEHAGIDLLKWPE